MGVPGSPYIVFLLRLPESDAAHSKRFDHTGENPHHRQQATRTALADAARVLLNPPISCLEA